MASAVAAAKAWRSVPAPKRGEAVRLMGEELRKYKSELGSLVSLEMGKIKAEGDGEVQEMIDIADFAVGQSRMLYGVQMHSERPNHRMFEQWHPLGVVGVISAFNFPVAVWSWNAFLAAICGNVTVWKPSPKTPLCAVAVQHICNRVLERTACRRSSSCSSTKAPNSRSVSSRTVASTWFRSPVRRRWAATSASAWQSDSARRCWNSAATTRSSSTSTPTSTWWCPPSSSAPSARRASAARRRAAYSCTNRSMPELERRSPMRTSRSASATRSRRAR